MRSRSWPVCSAPLLGGLTALPASAQYHVQNDFRADARFEDMVAKLRQAQAEAEVQCF